MSEVELPPEDAARANFYALLARLFYAPPDRELLQALGGAEEIAADSPGYGLSSAWRDLKSAAGQADADAVRDEYDSVFVGTGKAEVTLYAGAYLSRTALDLPLVEIRRFLAAQGLERKGNAQEPEDHVSALCDAMRHFILRSEPDVQREFFERFVEPAASRLCDAVIRCEHVNFYLHAARFLKCFVEPEHTAFDMD